MPTTTEELDAPLDDARDPSLEDVLQLAREVTLDGINVMLPGKIVSYDAGKQTAVVQPLVQKRYLAEDGQTYVSQDLPPIQGAPVVHFGPARARLTTPVAAGDICEVRFSSASLSRWIALPSGGTVNPGDDRQHDLSDAIVCVGLHSPANPPTDAPTDAVVMHLSGGVTMKIGSSSASNKVLTTVDGNQILTALASAITAQSGNPPGAAALTALYSALTNGGSPPGPPFSLTPFPTGSSKLATDG